MAMKTYLGEPVVEALLAHNVVTRSACVLRIDMQTAKKESFDCWHSKFHLPAIIAASTHGIYAW
jgi:hypothetical protein